MNLRSLVFASAALLGTIALTGCATSAENIGSGDEALTGGVSVPNPSGAYLASISANGTGCPAGTWAADISPDGEAFTVTFSAYEATVDPGQAFSIKDCTLALDLKTPEGFSFSVSSFHYQGYAILDRPGMSASQTAKYYFQGNPLPATENRSDMRGAYDDSYVFSDEIGVADLVWSPCGASRTLEAQTRLVLKNNAAKTGSGYLNTTSVDGEVKTVFRFGLSWRQCGDPGAGAGPTGLAWSSAGPIQGKHCVKINEPADPDTWNDNYLCMDHDVGMRWSYAGPIAGMSCLSMNEGAEPAQHGWADNYLCSPRDFGLAWSTAGALPGMRCTQIRESADPNTWNDNFLCQR